MYIVYIWCDEYLNINILIRYKVFINFYKVLCQNTLVFLPFEQYELEKEQEGTEGWLNV